MGISVLYPDLADRYVICTSATRPPAVEGTLIYETDTNRLLVCIDGAWTPADPRSGSNVYNEYGTIIGTNDFVGAAWTTIIFSKTITVPAWGTTVHWDLVIGCGGLTSTSAWDMRLVYVLTPVMTYTSINSGGGLSLMTVRFRGSIAAGGTGPVLIVFQAQRTSGSGGIRQSTSHFAGEIWVT